MGRLSPALHLQAGPTSWTPNLGLMPGKEAGRCRTDAEFKLQIDNNTLRLLLSDLATEEQLGKTQKLHPSAVPCGNCHTACLSTSTGRAAPSSCLHSGLQTSAEQVLTALITREKKTAQLLQPGHLKKHWERLTSGASLPHLAVKELEWFVFLK